MKESGCLQLRTSDPQEAIQQRVRSLPGETSPPIAELRDLKEIDAILKRVAPQSVMEESIPSSFGRKVGPEAYRPYDSTIPIGPTRVNFSNHQ